MLPTVVKIFKFASVPMLLVAGGVLPRVTGEYESFLTAAICICVLAAAAVSVVKREFFLTAGFLSVAVIFSPFLLVTRIFLLMSLAVIVTLLTLVAAFLPATFHGENDLPH